MKQNSVWNKIGNMLTRRNRNISSDRDISGQVITGNISDSIIINTAGIAALGQLEIQI